jgi:hypothetical protein
MVLRLVALGLLVAAGVWLRIGPRGDERRTTLVVLVVAVMAALLTGLQTLDRGVDLVDAYVVAGLGALAVSGRDGLARPAMGLALALFGAALAAASFGGAAPAASQLALGPALLALTIAAAVGALAALAVGRAVRAGAPLMLPVAVAVLLLFCTHRPGEVESNWWGVLGGLRSGDEAVFVFGPQAAGQLGQPLVVSRGTAGLLGLSAVVVVLATAVVTGLRLRRWLCLAATLLTVAAGAWLAAEGLAVEVGEGTRASLELWTVQGSLQPPAVGPVFLDLVTLLPALAAFSLAAGLLEQAARPAARPADAREEAASHDLDVALIAGALLLSALVGVWREVWGTGLGHCW